ncbi:MAG: hypothetical protein K6G76_03300 [Lachnospiraceae bacterium]|nr:hypothetical protein [Lachnospiraceae bacterium]
MGYKIGSFNLRNLGLSAMGEKNERDLKKIAEIIRREQFDVVALQEVLSEGKAFTSPDFAKKSVLMELGDDWDFQWANAETQLTDTRNEGYAFVWNRRRLRLATVNTMDGRKRTFYPRICRLSKEYMQRRPYYARFTPAGTIEGGPWIEFRLLCIHTFYGKDTMLDRSIRQRELDVLIKDIYPQISDRRYGEYGNGMPSYTLIMGDYNVELWRSWKDEARKKVNVKRRSQGKAPYPKPASLLADENDIIESTRWGKRQVKTVQYEYTTLRASDDNPDIEESRGYAHDYDHFSFEESQFEGLKMKVKRVDAVRKYCGDDFDAYLKSVSDHVPIAMEIDIK